MSERGMKKIIAVIIDVVFLAVIVIAVYLLTRSNSVSINENILYAIIILLIPAGFYVTYMSFSKEIDWNKLPGDEIEDEDEDETENASEDDLKP
jgi:glucose uptake protein GlcU